MKMLFYSSDVSEVDRVSQEFLNASIPCEIRNGPAVNGSATQPHQAELWIRNDRDCHRAFMLCVHLGVGFAKRAPRKPMFDDSDFDAPLEPDREAEGEGAPNGKEARESEAPNEKELRRLVYARRVRG